MKSQNQSVESDITHINFRITAKIHNLLLDFMKQEMRGSRQNAVEFIVTNYLKDYFDRQQIKSEQEGVL